MRCEGGGGGGGGVSGIGGGGGSCPDLAVRNSGYFVGGWNVTG